MYIYWNCIDIKFDMVNIGSDNPSTWNISPFTSVLALFQWC